MVTKCGALKLVAAYPLEDAVISILVKPQSEETHISNNHFVPTHIYIYVCVYIYYPKPS